MPEFTGNPEIDRAYVNRWAKFVVEDQNAIVLDTETTHLKGHMCEIAVVRVIDGTVLMNTLVNPLEPVQAKAFETHGITDAELRTAPVFCSVWPDLQAILDRHIRVITYGAHFDSSILNNDLERIGEYDHMDRGRTWECAMTRYAAWNGKWNEYRGNYTWVKLPGGNHRALGDVQATIDVIREMAEG